MLTDRKQSEFSSNTHEIERRLIWRSDSLGAQHFKPFNRRRPAAPEKQRPLLAGDAPFRPPGRTRPLPSPLMQP
jgi:hypothetical protein